MRGEASPLSRPPLSVSSSGMPNPRRKGQSGEREFASKFGGRRIARDYQSGPDVITPPLHLRRGLRLWEVKRSNRIRLYEWAHQAREEGADALAVRSDREEWLVVIPASMLTEDVPDLASALAF